MAFRHDRARSGSTLLGHLPRLGARVGHTASEVIDFG
jgi:hypothetical protein